MEQAGGTGELVNAPGLGKEAVGDFVRQRERPGLPSQALAWPPRLSAGRRESGSQRHWLGVPHSRQSHPTHRALFQPLASVSAVLPTRNAVSLHLSMVAWLGLGGRSQANYSTSLCFGFPLCKWESLRTRCTGLLRGSNEMCVKRTAHSNSSV